MSTPARRTDLLALVGGLTAAVLLVLLLRPTAQAAVTGVDAADGLIGDRVVTAFDVDQPAVARLDPALRRSLQTATRDAAAAGLHLRVNSGWRSVAYQRALLDRAVREYGDLRAARRWVSPPARSTHVRGAAVDVGPPAGAAWLGDHGAAYGLCRVYANEPWHFERLTTPGGGCPAMRDDARS